MESVKTTERLTYLDAARGLGMILVVLGHVWDNASYGSIWIYSFHVPLFFIISGMLIRENQIARRSWGVIVKKQLKGLLIPYIVYEILFIGLFGVLNHFQYNEWSGHLYGGIFLSPKNAPVWFLATLFVAEILLIFALKLEKKSIVAGIIAIVFFIVSLLSGHCYAEHEIIASVFRCMISYSFLCLGYYLLPFIKRIRIPAIVCFILLVAEGFLASINGKTGIFTLTWNNAFIYTVCAVVGSMAIIFILKDIRVAPLEVVGTSTITILGLHIIIQRLLEAFSPIALNTTFIGVITTALIIVILTIGHYILKKLGLKYL